MLTISLTVSFQDEYPVIWSLTDKATDEPIVCFKFKINIV